MRGGAACCRATWEVLIRDHHAGFIDWDTYQANQARIGANIRPVAHQPAPARSGRAARCCKAWRPAAPAGASSPCSTRARASPRPATTAPAPANWSTGAARGTCASAASAIDAAVTGAFLAALAPAGVQACLAAAEQLEAGHDAALAQWRRQVERARYQAAKAERRYLAVDPDNRLVARGLEADWEKALRPSSPTPKPNWPAARHARPRPSPPTSGPRSWPSARTCSRSGTRPPPPTGTAKNCSAPCSTK